MFSEPRQFGSIPLYSLVSLSGVCWNTMLFESGRYIGTRVYMLGVALPAAIES